MPPPAAYDSVIFVRVHKKTRERFYKIAETFGRPSDVLREIIDTFVEDFGKGDDDEKSGKF